MSTSTAIMPALLRKAEAIDGLGCAGGARSPGPQTLLDRHAAAVGPRDDAPWSSVTKPFPPAQLLIAQVAMAAEQG